jgi:hypothetical protein
MKKLLDYTTIYLERRVFMEARRKMAYRRILYAALLDIRALSGGSRTIFRNKGLNIWQLSFAFHNLAKFSAEDFDGFDEDFFWKDIEVLKKKYPKTNDYQMYFNALLKDDPRSMDEFRD